MKKIKLKKSEQKFRLWICLVMTLVGTSLSLSTVAPQPQAHDRSGMRGVDRSGDLGAESSKDPIVHGFRKVPASSRLRMFWRVFGPAWTRPEIDRQLDELKRAGIGGVMTCFTYPVALDDPAHGIVNRPFLSPEFLETLHYAADRAHQMGIQFDIGGGTGWPFGGPTVSLADSAQRIRPVMLKPEPDGLRCRMPPLRESETVLAVFQGTRNISRNIRGADLILDGRSAEACQAFITGPTYMHVKRPALGAEGYIVDHYSREATLRYLESYVAPVLNAAPHGTIRTLFCDSLEVYGANWTADLPAEFQKRRGYALIPHLPELFDTGSLSNSLSNSRSFSRSLRFDFWRTLAELAEERFARTVGRWCRAHGVEFALEAYGTPPMGFTAARYADVPWGEQYEWRGFSFSRFASSGAHLAGKNLIGAEAWTWTGIPNRMADSLSDLKLCSDLHFLSGENLLTGVDYPYSPASAGAPGWTPYYGPVFNENNPQWPFFSALSDYVGRCQWLLQQGRPVADVALYVPTEDAFADGPVDQMPLDFQLRDRLASGELTDEFGLKNAYRHRSHTIEALLAHGYNFDGIDFFALNRLAKVERGELRAGLGRYRILVLPNLHGIEIDALQKIARFCKSGGTLIALKGVPHSAFGARTLAQAQRLHTLLQELFPVPATATEPVTRPYGRGRTILVPDDTSVFGKALDGLQGGPDVRLNIDNADSTLCHVHRHAESQDIYFLTNVGDLPQNFEASFRVGHKSATLFNALDGTIEPIACDQREAGRTRVTLSLPPRGSIFVMFAPTTSLAPPNASPPSVSSVVTRVPLSSDWQVSFEGPDAPPSRPTSVLESWTSWPGGKYFSGRATYRTTFVLPTPAPQRLRLRLAQVHEVAGVAINGKSVGTVWLPPYEIDLSGGVQPGINRLEITVANLPVNRVLGQPDTDMRAYRAIYGDRFPAPQEKQIQQTPSPSGLIGTPEIWALTGPK